MTAKRIIAPWTNNPSAPDNFYELNEEFSEIDENILMDIDESAVAPNKTKKHINAITKDPYSDILNEL